LSISGGTGVDFVSFAVVEWIDVFTRNEYKDILLDSLRYCYIPALVEALKNNTTK
jgi:hypothetical protein